jgi:hypothetical protein
LAPLIVNPEGCGLAPPGPPNRGEVKLDIGPRDSGARAREQSTLIDPTASGPVRRNSHCNPIWPSARSMPVVVHRVGLVHLKMRRNAGDPAVLHAGEIANDGNAELLR